jgi:transcriptional regulator with XRE-family HTH domain
MILKNLPFALRDLRMQSGMDVADMARVLEVRPDTISTIESGERSLAIDTVILWAKACGRIAHVEFRDKEDMSVQDSADELASVLRAMSKDDQELLLRLVLALPKATDLWKDLLADQISTLVPTRTPAPAVSFMQTGERAPAPHTWTPAQTRDMQVADNLREAARRNSAVPAEERVEVPETFTDRMLEQLGRWTGWGPKDR